MKNSVDSTRGVTPVSSVGDASSFELTSRRSCPLKLHQALQFSAATPSDLPSDTTRDTPCDTHQRRVEGAESWASRAALRVSLSSPPHRFIEHVVVKTKGGSENLCAGAGESKHEQVLTGTQMPEVSIVAKEFQRVCNGAQESQQASTGAEEFQEVSIGAQESQQVSTGAQESLEVSTGAQESLEVSTGAQDSQQASTGPQQSPLVTTGAQEFQQDSTRAQSHHDYSDMLEETKQKALYWRRFLNDIRQENLSTKEEELAKALETAIESLENGTWAQEDETGAMEDGTGPLQNDIGLQGGGSGALKDGTGALEDGMGALKYGTGAIKVDTGSQEDDTETSYRVQYWRRYLNDIRSDRLSRHMPSGQDESWKDLLNETQQKVVYWKQYLEEIRKDRECRRAYAEESRQLVANWNLTRMSIIRPLQEAGIPIGDEVEKKKTCTCVDGTCTDCMDDYILVSTGTQDSQQASTGAQASPQVTTGAQEFQEDGTGPLENDIGLQGGGSGALQDGTGALEDGIGALKYGTGAIKVDTGSQEDDTGDHETSYRVQYWKRYLDEIRSNRLSKHMSSGQDESWKDLLNETQQKVVYWKQYLEKIRKDRERRRAYAEESRQLVANWNLTRMSIIRPLQEAGIPIGDKDEKEKTCTRVDGTCTDCMVDYTFDPAASSTSLPSLDYEATKLVKDKQEWEVDDEVDEDDLDEAETMRRPSKVPEVTLLLQPSKVVDIRAPGDWRREMRNIHEVEDQILKNQQEGSPMVKLQQIKYWVMTKRIWAGSSEACKEFEEERNSSICPKGCPRSEGSCSKCLMDEIFGTDTGSDTTKLNIPQEISFDLGSRSQLDTSDLPGYDADMDEDQGRVSPSSSISWSSIEYPFQTELPCMSSSLGNLSTSSSEEDLSPAQSRKRRAEDSGIMDEVPSKLRKVTPEPSVRRKLKVVRRPLSPVDSEDSVWF